MFLKFYSAFTVLLRIILWMPIFIIIALVSPQIFSSLFQNKYLKPISEVTDDEDQSIKDALLIFSNKFDVHKEDQKDFIKTLDYFKQFENNILYDEHKNNPTYPNVYYIVDLISLAKEAIEHLEQVTSDNKRISYYEEKANASLDDLIQLYLDKLNAKNEHKLSALAAKREIQLKKYIVKLKKHDPLFTNFYLMLFVLYPISNLKFKKEDEQYIELIQDLFEFFRIGHATKLQICKSVAIQIYKLYEKNISKVDSKSKTTDIELKKQIGRLIDLTLHTDKAYKNFNNIDEEPYIKNIIYNFPLFECNTKLANKQIRRFKFYFVGKNKLVPTYFPRFFRRWALNKFIKTPHLFYARSRFVTLFGLFQKKI